MSTKNLKPCPFCGGVDLEEGGNYVTCRGCEASSYVEDSRAPKGEPVRRWNMRASLLPADQTEANAALEAAAAVHDEAAQKLRARVIT